MLSDVELTIKLKHITWGGTLEGLFVFLKDSPCITYMYTCSHVFECQTSSVMIISHSILLIHPILFLKNHTFLIMIYSNSSWHGHLLYVHITNYYCKHCWSRVYKWPPWVHFCHFVSVMCSQKFTFKIGKIKLTNASDVYSLCIMQTITRVV